MIKGGYVYILASRRNGTLYTGVTSDLARRVFEHREGLLPGFTRDYAVKMLVWHEHHADIEQAIRREKRIKELAARMEAAVDRGDQPGLARSLSRTAAMILPFRHPGEGRDPVPVLVLGPGLRRDDGR